MRIGERALAPGFQVLSLRVEHDDLRGWIIALEPINVSPGIDGDGGHRAPAIAGRQLSPVVDPALCAFARPRLSKPWACRAEQQTGDRERADQISEEDTIHNISVTGRRHLLAPPGGA